MNQLMASKWRKIMLLKKIIELDDKQKENAKQPKEGNAKQSTSTASKKISWLNEWRIIIIALVLAWVAVFCLAFKDRNVSYCPLMIQVTTSVVS